MGTKFATLLALGSLASLWSASTEAKCMDERAYAQVPAAWRQVNPTGKVMSDRVWPPKGTYALFYFPEPKLQHATGELARFRIGYVHSCDVRGPGSVTGACQ